MSFDIYAGGFARYYAREWENVAQKYARENGVKYQMIHAGDDSGPAEWSDVESAVGHWRAAIVGGLGENAPSDLEWSESRDAPYFTDRPGWDGYTALVVLAACSACGEPLPDFLPEDGLASEVVVRTYDPQMSNANRSITQAGLWIPGSFEFSFDFESLTGDSTHIGSVKRLVSDLQALRDKYPLSREEADELYAERPEDEPPPFMALAHFGLDVFSAVANDAKKHHLPILLSF